MEYFSKTQQVNKQTENYGNLLREVRERIAAKETEILDVNKEFSVRLPFLQNTKPCVSKKTEIEWGANL